MSMEKELLERGDDLFRRRSSILSLWQHIAEQFYVQRADFTARPDIGTDYAAHLYSSYPLYVHRELATSFASMLRPRNQAWFETTIEEEDRLTSTEKQWLQMASKRQRMWMYDTRTNFSRATSQGDHDYAAFGQTVISVDMDWHRDPPGLVFQCWHLRDVAWDEAADGSVSEVHRKWKPRICDLDRFYHGKLHPNVQKHTGTSRKFSEIPVRVVVVRSEEYHGLDPDAPRMRHPWVRLVIDEDNRHTMQRLGMWTPGYVVPRWQTVSGSPYAYSPATIIGLPDARLIQAMTLTLLEAGEMAVRPPLLGTQEAVRSDVNIFAGGITWVDSDYEGRKHDALRPLQTDTGGLPFGLELDELRQTMLAAAFYLNKLTLPQPEREMTAYETGQRIQEYIRQALPLFEPMEVEYNGGVCELTFDLLLRAGAFGPLTDIPPNLLGENIRFKFKSPLHDAIERQKGARFMETKDMIQAAMELDPSSVVNIDVHVALRDALDGIGSPAEWMRNRKVVDMLVERMKRQAEASREAQVAAQVGDAAGALQDVA